MLRRWSDFFLCGFLPCQLSSVFAWPPFLIFKIGISPHIFCQFLSLHIDIMCTALYLWIMPPTSWPTQTPQFFGSFLVLLWACSTVCDFILWTSKTKANSSYTFPRLRAFMCYSVRNLPLAIHRYHLKLPSTPPAGCYSWSPSCMAESKLFAWTSSRCFW